MNAETFRLSLSGRRGRWFDRRTIHPRSCRCAKIGICHSVWGEQSASAIDRAALDPAAASESTHLRKQSHAIANRSLWLTTYWTSGLSPHFNCRNVRVWRRGAYGSKSRSVDLPLHGSVRLALWIYHCTARLLLAVTLRTLLATLRVLEARRIELSNDERLLFGLLLFGLLLFGLLLFGGRLFGGRLFGMRSQNRFH